MSVIKVRTETERLDKLKHKDQIYDGVISELLDQLEKRKRG